MNQDISTHLDERKVLEEFVLNNPNLQELETKISQFNIFEAIGMVSQEIRHSRFLAFLLDPSANHGLDDYFLKRLLMRILANSDNAPFSLIEIDVADLSKAFVQCEWQNIDVLIVDEATRIAIVIENKIGSGEHSNQLARYRESVLRNYPAYRHVFLFLTPDEVQPSDDNYIPVGYSIIASILDEVLLAKASVLGTEVASLIEHYISMLRRHVVSDSEIAELCQKIYQRHRRALDLIYEHRPDIRAEIRDYLSYLIAESQVFEFDECSKADIRFLPSLWDQNLSLLRGEGWTSSGRMLLFQFYNYSNRLELNLWIGPGPEPIRESLLNIATSNSHFYVSQSKVKKWRSIYIKKFLTAGQLTNSTFDELIPEIDKCWKQFMDSDLQPILNTIEQEIDWIELEQSI